MTLANFTARIITSNIFPKVLGIHPLMREREQT
jgi:hypothetical protein